MQTDPTIDPVADPANQPIDDPAQQRRPAPGLPPDMDPLAAAPSHDEEESAPRSTVRDERASPR
ncbi:hypothetical protein [Paraburkholderia hospita]|uniref:hypothetical protein n=1 Tax=Paraburkholderia TaxID=1822464 RepID=UPI000B345D55|nr:hypothetical protein [Paraburkholderia hospita]OUL80849.1 hypothetical protein CA601_32100 [Paraburkholderia hospita]